MLREQRSMLKTHALVLLRKDLSVSQDFHVQCILVSVHIKADRLWVLSIFLIWYTPDTLWSFPRASLRPSERPCKTSRSLFCAPHWKHWRYLLDLCISKKNLRRMCLCYDLKEKQYLIIIKKLYVIVAENLTKLSSQLFSSFSTQII